MVGLQYYDVNVIMEKLTEATEHHANLFIINLRLPQFKFSFFLVLFLPSFDAKHCLLKDLASFCSTSNNVFQLHPISGTEMCHNH